MLGRVGLAVVLRVIVPIVFVALPLRSLPWASIAPSTVPTLVGSYRLKVLPTILVKPKPSVAVVLTISRFSVLLLFANETISISKLSSKGEETVSWLGMSVLSMVRSSPALSNIRTWIGEKGRGEPGMLTSSPVPVVAVVTVLFSSRISVVLPDPPSPSASMCMTLSHAPINSFSRTISSALPLALWWMKVNCPCPPPTSMPASRTSSKVLSETMASKALPLGVSRTPPFGK